MNERNIRRKIEIIRIEKNVINEIHDMFSNMELTERTLILNKLVRLKAVKDMEMLNLKNIN